jgi:ATP synthase subunit 6
MGLPLWLSLILSRFFNRFSRFIGSLLPGGAPDVLNPFLVLIERVRILVRPITLSFRLRANITAGHVILSLIRSYVIRGIFLISWWSFIFLFLLQMGYIIFEVGICFLQSYIFCLLLTLYADEHRI